MNIHEINGLINLVSKPIKSHILGLLLFKGETEIHLEQNQVEKKIPNRHLSVGRTGTMYTQEELMTVDLEEFA